MSLQEDPAISVAVLNRLRDETGDEDGSLVRELVQVFCADAEESCLRLMALTEAGDASALSREAHRIKSGAANMGALHMAALCKEVEAVSGEGDLAAATQGVLQLRDEVPRAVAALWAYVEAL